MANCQDCKHFGHDLEDAFCCHPIALARSCWGWSLQSARSPRAFCGPSAKCFELDKPQQKRLNERHD